MGEGESGWFYVGHGQLRYKNGKDWTDEYRDIDETPEPQPTESQPLATRASRSGASRSGATRSGASRSDATRSGNARRRKHVAVRAGVAAVVVLLAAIGIYVLAFRALPTSVSWTQSVSAVGPGDYLTISGQVTPADKGRQILLETASVAQGKWQRLPQASVTDSRGRFAITLKPKLSGSVVMRVVIDPAGRQVEAVGSPKPLRLLSSSKVTLKPGGQVPVGTPMTFTIAVSPPGSSRTVRIERSADRRNWAPVGSPARTSKNGTLLMHVPNPSVGLWSYRAIVARDGRFATATSVAVTAES